MLPLIEENIQKHKKKHTVGGRNPAPPWMVKIL
jgi:hypothetical protein